MSDEGERFEPIQSSYGMTNAQEMVSYYDEWAKAYENDVNAIGWIGWRIVVDDFLRHAQPKPGSRLLDFGCGTGNAGAYLKARNPSVDIIGVDVSTGMLDLAREKNCYGELRRIEDTSDILAERYDGIICSGVFTHSHITADEVKTLLKALKPGGLISVSARESFVTETKMNTIVENLDPGRFQVLQNVRDAPYQELISSPEARGAYWVIKNITPN